MKILVANSQSIAFALGFKRQYVSTFGLTITFIIVITIFLTINQWFVWSIKCWKTVRKCSSQFTRAPNYIMRQKYLIYYDTKTGNLQNFTF